MPTLKIAIRKLDAQIATECARLSCAFIADFHNPDHSRPGEFLCKWCGLPREGHHVVAN